MFMDDDIEKQLRDIDKIQLDYLYFAVGVDGIPYDLNKALDPNLTCKCVEITKKTGKTGVACWKPGVIGLIGEDEVGTYCAPDKRVFPESAQGLSKRLEAFEEASAVCEASGARTLEDRLACMSVELHEKNTNLAQIG
jgi:hypothetical protein